MDFFILLQIWYEIQFNYRYYYYRLTNDRLFQISLSRHVNSHFKPPSAPVGLSSRRATPDSTPIKFYIRKTRRKHRTASRRSTPAAVNSADTFDVGTMAGVKDGLSKIKRKSRGTAESQLDDIGFDGTGTAVVLWSRVLGRRLEADGAVSLLVHWHPPGM